MRKFAKEINQKSIKGQIWKKKNCSSEFKNLLQKEQGMSDILAEMLAVRFDSLDKALPYIDPSVKKNMKDPYSLKYMDKVTDVLIDALTNNKKIAVFGDYDVDGGTSSALLKNYFAAIGVDMGIYIPDRIVEGYGPNTKAFKTLKEQGYDLVITVDCGASSFEPLEQAKQMGLDVIVIDHHMSSGDKPEALAIVNPNQDDDESEYGYLSAVGVCFLVLVALQSKLKKQGYFTQKKEPKLLEFLDLVALGTVCDVVPLIGLNRAYVAAGLKQMQTNPRLGIKALATSASLNLAEIESYHLGFVLGPRINAGGRVGEASLGASLLSCADEEEAYKMAARLEIHNKERKAIEHQVQEQAMLQVEERNLSKEPVIIVHNLDITTNQITFPWHPGVIGIVASRIKEKYNRPTAVISFDEGIGKASCRSIKGVDFGTAVIEAKENDLLVNGGGHKMAAGFTLEADKLEKFTSYVSAQIAPQTELAIQNKEVSYDYDFAASALSVDLCKELQLLAPFGVDNREPRFVVSNCRIVNMKIMAEKHLKLILADQASGLYGKSIEAILWKAVDTPLLEAISKNPRGVYSFLGSLKINVWQERERVQFEIEDIRS